MTTDDLLDQALADVERLTAENERLTRERALLLADAVYRIGVGWRIRGVNLGKEPFPTREAAEADYLRYCEWAYSELVRARLAREAAP